MQSLDMFLIFLRLGLTSFGGPIAHLGYFQREFVERRGWFTQAAYADLVALCQMLPGPTSSQVGFAIGMKRAGFAGALAAWLGFTAPSAIAMLLIAGQAAWFATRAGGALAHGLQLAAAAIVTQAVFQMARGLRGWAWAIALGAFAVLLFGRAGWLQPALIAAGGLIAMLTLQPVTPSTTPVRVHWAGAATAIAIVALVALAGPAVFAALGFASGEMFAACFRAGALVFGGGHVVLPLLEADFVGRNWIGAADFLAGYGAAQAMPGPLFSFAAFLGAASRGGGAVGGLTALTGLFLPGLALVAALLPVWERAKTWSRMQAFSIGAGAVVVGVLGAALYDPILTSSVKSLVDAAIVAAGAFALVAFRAPSWVVVLAVGAAGFASASA